MTTHAHTADLGDEFFVDLVAMAKRHGWNPAHLAAVWMSESGLLARAHNPNGHASGIFQAMPSTLKTLGYQGTHDSFRQLTATQQLIWAERYYGAHQRNTLDSPERIYLATFMPALLTMRDSNAQNFVICSSQGPSAWAYTPNKTFDRDNKGWITVSDLARAIERACTGTRWAEIVERLADAAGTTTPPAMPPSWHDLQRELAARRLYSGAIDGVPGPLTRGAVAALLRG